MANHYVTNFKRIGPFNFGNARFEQHSALENDCEVSFELRNYMTKKLYDQLFNFDSDKYKKYYILCECDDTPKKVGTFDSKLEELIANANKKIISFEEDYHLEFGVTEMPGISKVIFNDPATIAIWADGTKTIVKAEKGTKFDPHVGLAMCITKKYFGSKNSFDKFVKRYLKESEN